MKKLGALCGLLLMAGVAWGQVEVTGDMIPITWDAPTQLEDGNPIPPGVVITYSVRIESTDLTESYDLGSTTELTFVVDVPDGSTLRWDVGVRAIIDGLQSQFLWGSLGGVPEPWVIVWSAPVVTIPPSPPTGLRIQ